MTAYLQPFQLDIWLMVYVRTSSPMQRRLKNVLNSRFVALVAAFQSIVKKDHAEEILCNFQGMISYYL